LIAACSVQQLGVGWEADVLGLHRGVDREPLEVARAQRADLVRHPQALGQQQFQLVAEPLPPMAQVGALVRELVLEKLTDRLVRCGRHLSLPIWLGEWKVRTSKLANGTAKRHQWDTHYLIRAKRARPRVHSRARY
jgi:hypothetical protein